jgi:hypothetical protein
MSDFPDYWSLAIAPCIASTSAIHGGRRDYFKAIRMQK